MDPSLQDLLNDLYSRRAGGIKLGLGTVRALLRELGDPHVGAPIVHVAGTNGKGSVVAMLDSILRMAGFLAARYTSPHLLRFNERLSVGDVEISDDALYPLLLEVEQAARDLEKSSCIRAPTFFEFTTAAAFAWFRREQADPWILETGLGGRLDATNVVEPMVTAITSIGIDHASFLGDSIGDVAREKAGIIKPGVPVVVGEMPPAARSVIEETARVHAAPVINAADRVSVRKSRAKEEITFETGSNSLGPLRFPLRGEHQVGNARVALAVAEILSELRGYKLSACSLSAGLESVTWAGRGQLVSGDPPVFLDCAHNPDGAKSLVETVNELWPGRPAALVAGFSRDKDVEGIFRAVGPRFDPIWIVELRNPARLPLPDALKASRRAGVRARSGDLGNACADAIRWAIGEGDGVVCVAGSVYLAGEYLEQAAGEGSVPRKSAILRDIA